MPGNALAVGLSVAGAILGTGLAAWHISSWWIVKACEKPAYTLLRRLDVSAAREGGMPVGRGVEIRRYSPFLVATFEVKGAATLRDALSRGFRKCAGYIFGKNDSVSGAGSESIAMTSPVISDILPREGGASTSIASMARFTEAGSIRVTFTMPSKWTMATLPKPHDSDVQLREEPGRTLAAITWSGASPSEAKVAVMDAVLRFVLAQAGVQVKQGARLSLWQYDPPFSPSYMRTNEVLLEVEYDGDGEGVEKKGS